MGLSEKEWQKQIIELAGLLGWVVAHFRPAQTKSGWVTPVAADGKGFPDLVLVRDRIVFAELKAQKGKLSADQSNWIEWLRDADVEVYVWRPDDIDEVIETLTAHERKTS